MSKVDWETITIGCLALMGIFMLFVFVDYMGYQDYKPLNVEMKNVSNMDLNYTLYMDGVAVQSGVLAPGEIGHHAQVKAPWHIGIHHSWSHTVSIRTPHTVHERVVSSMNPDQLFVLD